MLGKIFIFSFIFYRVESQVGHYCPCNFNFVKATNGTPDCIAKIELISGIKEILADAKLKTQHGKQSFNFTVIMNYTCSSVDAFVLNLTAKEANEVEAKINLAKFSLFYVYSQDNQTTCAYYNEIALINGSCEFLAANNRKISSAICIASPIDAQNDADLDKAAGQCICPCGYFDSNSTQCFRQVWGCAPIIGPDDMILMCSSDNLAPAVVARVRTAADASTDWPPVSLFFVGETPPTPYNVSDNTTQCGYYDSQNKEFIPSSKSHHGSISCQQIIENDETKLSFSFFSVICVTHYVNKAAQGDCGTYEEQLELDEEDCGVEAIEGNFALFLGIVVITNIWDFWIYEY